MLGGSSPACFCCGRNSFRSAKDLFDEFQDQRILFPAYEPDLRGNDHGMEEITQLMILYVDAFFLQKHIHHPGFVTETFAVGSIQVYRRETGKIAQERREIRAVQGQVPAVVLDDLVRSEYDPVIGLVGTLIIAVCIMQELDYGRTGNKGTHEA